MMLQRHKRPSKGALIRWIVSLVTVFFLALTAGCGGKNADKPADLEGGQPDISAVFATYNDGEMITGEDFNAYTGLIKLNFFMEYGDLMFVQMIESQFTMPEVQQSIIKQIFAYRVLADQASDQTKQDATRMAAEQAQQLRGMLDPVLEGGFDALLTEFKLTENKLNETIAQNIAVSIEANKKVTDEQIKDEYDSKLQEDPNVFTVATVRHVLIGTINPETQEEIRPKEEALKRAEEVIQKLKSGESFDALAKQYSDDGGSKDTGGKYADYDVNLWVAEFKEATLNLPIDEISDPVETQFGYHVMKVEARSSRSLDEVKESLRPEVGNKQVFDFMESAIGEYNLVITLPEPAEGTDVKDE